MPDQATARRRPSHVLLRESDAAPLPAEPGGVLEVHYVLRDDGDLAVVDADGPHTGYVVSVTDLRSVEPSPDGELVIAVRAAGTAGASAYRALVGPPGHRHQAGVTVLPSEVDVFDRLRGIFESDRLRDTCVLIVGCGSGGSFVVRELVRSGVGRFVLVDHDRMEVANVCRHELGLADLGRLKTNAMRDYILERNPGATVDTHAFRLDGASFEEFLTIVRSVTPDLIICGTDNRESRLLVNRASILTGTPTIYGGVRRRAYAGQVLRVIPGLTPCYQCFIHGLPELARDTEVSSEEAARRVAYSDRPVTPEPGLSTDIAPVALFMAKLALVELTEGRGSPVFDSLREDLVAPWYFWLNRREAGTEYEGWPPLHDQVGGPAVLRWIGQWLARDPQCAACGTPAVTVSEEEVALFSDADGPTDAGSGSGGGVTVLAGPGVGPSGARSP